MSPVRTPSKSQTLQLVTSETRISVVRYIKTHPGTSLGPLRKSLNLSFQLALYHVNQLVSCGAAYVVNKRGPRKCYALNEEVIERMKERM